MRHLDLALLQTFVAIADNGSFTQAASTIPLKSHEALALTRAQQIDQPHEPVSALVEAALGGS